MTERTEAERLQTFREAIAAASEILASGRYDFALHRSLTGLIEHASGIILTTEHAKLRLGEQAAIQGLVQGGFQTGQGRN